MLNLAKYLIWLAKTTWDYFWEGVMLIVDMLNPFKWIVQGAYWMASVLPDPLDISGFLDAFGNAMYLLVPSFQLINHFVNLPLFAAAIAIMLVIETAAGVIRMWRLIRSFIT